MLFVLAFGNGVGAEPARRLDPTSLLAAQQPRSNPDFLFSRPRGSVSLKGTWFLARADSDVFDFVEQQLTVDRRDFNAPGLATSIAIAITPWIDTEFGLDFSRASTASEYRHFFDQNRVPITQDTRLTNVDLSARVRVALLPRGREVSRLVWIPRPVVPYIGAGAGYLWYEFRQTGDFVDFVDRSIFTTTLRSSGWTPSAHVFVGTDVKLYRRLFVEIEGRYMWAHAQLRGDFLGFDPIDLSGTRLTAGVSYLF